MRGEEPHEEESRRCAPVSPLSKVLPLVLPLSLPVPLWGASLTFVRSLIFYTLSEDFRIGSSNVKEAANSGVCCLPHVSAGFA